MKKQFKKFILFFFILSLISIPVCLINFHFNKPSSPQNSFKEITEQLFLEDVIADTLNLHYTLAYPSHYGISSYPLTLPGYNENDQFHTFSRMENVLHSLSMIDPDSLSFEDRYTYYLLTDYLKHQKKGAPFALFEEVFSPSSGVPSQYPVLMAEYTFRTVTDVTDYLTLLSQTGTYFSSLLNLQEKRAEEGYTLFDDSLKETIALCDTIITEEALETHSHFLQQTFRERLQPLIAKNLISKEEANQYITQNDQILLEIVLPAYEMTADRLFLLKDSCSPAQGLCSKEQGKEYYNWLIAKEVGCSLTAEQMLEILEKDYEKNLLTFRKLQEQFASLRQNADYDYDTFPFLDGSAILLELENKMKNDFPSLSSLSDRPIETTVKSVSSCMEDYSSPAFYLTPPIDDIWQNTIYINQKETPQGLELFTTLAHEGYPGHLYQTVYYQLMSSQKNLPLIRHLMYYGGYVEGWAIYTEFLSYEYAASLFPEEQQEFYNTLFELLACDRKLQLGMLSMLDIKLHYYGITYEEAKENLRGYGIYEENTCQNVYQYILEEPGNYLKYYMGYLQILSLKEKAETLMGSSYSDYEFHKFFLNAGPSDFENLERRLREVYISSSSTDSR